MAEDAYTGTRGQHLYVRAQAQIIVTECHGRKLEAEADEPCLGEDGLADCPHCGWRMTAKRFGGKLTLLGLYR